ncbi:hypothetical protein [Natronococcus occultus]|uniref:Uncharacterized protein n=1 Tax=Natronococcus occultus SP4 TaxID=694430 RepID=L0K3P1_9EURY|nr:hypothetical protein [Natronococcus occultus]AGB39641.1 hypothetical protein Natoc_3943 [Natronococcus occultus SP4]
MMWQDLVFMVGSTLSILFLAPTLRDASARVPLGTSIPSMAIGMVYGTTFLTLGMTFSALGAYAAGSMWSLIATFRSPQRPVHRLVRTVGLGLFARDVRYWIDRRRGERQLAEQYVPREAPSTAHAD